MVFRAGFDPNRNTKGRNGDPNKEPSVTSKSRLRLLRQSIKKHVDEAILQAATTMKVSEKEETRLKAAIYIIDQYVKVHTILMEEERKLAQDRGEKAPPTDTFDEEETENRGAVFSLNLVSDDE